jgi:hypothetical protein
MKVEGMNSSQRKKVCEENWKKLYKIFLQQKNIRKIDFFY